jgi:hypothetical protein
MQSEKRIPEDRILPVASLRNSQGGFAARLPLVNGGRSHVLRVARPWVV